jgi:hypothetical protein
MITQENINQQRTIVAELAEKVTLSEANMGAFLVYLQQVAAGVWLADSCPITGPFTVAQAALIDVVIPSDFSYPLVFCNEEIFNKASFFYENNVGTFDELKSQYLIAKKNLVDMEDTYAADMARAAAIAAQDPAVIAAKANADAAKINADAEKAMQAKELANKKENRRILVTGLIGLLAVCLVVVFISKVLK